MNRATDKSSSLYAQTKSHQKIHKTNKNTKNSSTFFNIRLSNTFHINLTFNHFKQSLCCTYKNKILSNKHQRHHLKAITEFFYINFHEFSVKKDHLRITPDRNVNLKRRRNIGKKI